MTVDEQITSNSPPAPVQQQDEYSPMFDSVVRHFVQQTSSLDDGENENKYQIELAESESRPLMLYVSKNDSIENVSNIFFEISSVFQESSGCH